MTKYYIQLEIKEPLNLVQDTRWSAPSTKQLNKMSFQLADISFNLGATFGIMPDEIILNQLELELDNNNQVIINGLVQASMSVKDFYDDTFFSQKHILKSFSILLDFDNSDNATTELDKYIRKGFVDEVVQDGQICYFIAKTSDDLKNHISIRDRIELDGPNKTYDVKFELKSFYEDESYNLSTEITEIIEAENLDALFEFLDHSDYIMNIDDLEVINMDSDESPIETNIEYVLITDKDGKILFQNE